MTDTKIQVLESIVADQIAAGEVVERPGSVVKELVENSLDAGATTVQLDVDGGGAGRIRVFDNGEGIPRDQVALAFTRHATSKVRQLEDLASVATFGFRGEALPSIASVSRVVVRTRQQEDVAGAMIVIKGGELESEQDIGCPVGCDIEICDLFYNTPARLKFLKRESTETSHCSEALVRLAMLRPDVSFTMRSSGRRVRELPRVEEIEERVQAVFPKERLVHGQGTEHGIEVLAILGPPERARAGAGSLYTYVNGRFIRDKMLLGAITQAFAGTLERGRYPVGLISLNLPAGGIDVNVHPQKTEVRFADTSAVFRAVSHVVGAMVARAPWSFGADGSSQVSETPIVPYASQPEETPYRPSGRLVPPPSDPRPQERPLQVREQTFTQSSTSYEKHPPPSGNGQIDKIAEPSQSEATAMPVRHLSGTAPREAFSDLKYMGQAKGLFLILEDEDDLVIVDQHAAHERVTYERLRDQLDKGNIASQRLLVTHNVDLGPADADRIADLQDELLSLGLEVTRSGPDRVTIHGVPAELQDASPDRLLADMVLAIEEGRKGSKGEWADHTIATMACHSSIRAGRVVHPQEIDQLLKQMDKIDFAGHCPHGRPVLTRIPWREIRRRLGRG